MTRTKQTQYTCNAPADCRRWGENNGTPRKTCSFNGKRASAGNCYTAQVMVIIHKTIMSASFGCWIKPSTEPGLLSHRSGLSKENCEICYESCLHACISPILAHHFILMLEWMQLPLQSSISCVSHAEPKCLISRAGAYKLSIHTRHVGGLCCAMSSTFCGHLWYIELFGGMCSYGRFHIIEVLGAHWMAANYDKLLQCSSKKDSINSWW